MQDQLIIDTPPSTARTISVTVRCLLLLAFLCIAGSMNSMAQTSENLQVPPPLKLSDTSSPRASFEGFLRNTDAAIALWRARAPIHEQALYLRAAALSLDFDATPYGGSLTSQIRRVLLLREILARTRLPDPASIPDSAQVAATGLTSWTVPGTKLRMRLIETGPDAGEFRFDGATIENLGLYYRRVKDLPRLDGGMDAFQEYMDRIDRLGVTEEELATRLHGIRTFSPQATLDSFLFNINAAYRIAGATEAALQADPPRMTPEEALREQARAEDYLDRAAAAFDVSQVPIIQRDDARVEAALQLKEILDRMLLPPLEAVPDAAEVAELDPTQPYRWRLPGTRFEIERMQTGPNAGNYLFDAETVRLLPASYAALKDMPYREQSAADLLSEFRSPQLSPGFFENYISTPGNLVPSTNILGRLVDKLPNWTNMVISGQTIWQWAALAVTTLVAAVLCWLFFWGAGRAHDMVPSPLGDWVSIVPPLLSASVAQEAMRFIDADVNFTGQEQATLAMSVGVLVLALYVWAVWRLSKAIGSTILLAPTRSRQSIDASLIRIVSGIIAVVVAVGVLAVGLADLGVDVVPLLAGLGVGGLAVALAIRPTLENLIGGLILFSDKPVRVGDYCTFGGMSGTIEDVGVRSTQIRGIDRTLISVPNAKFVDMEIINWARCDKMLIQATIGLRYETSDDQLRYVLAKIREMAHAHPKIDNGTVRVRFAAYGGSSLDIGVRIYALTRDWNEFHAIREDVFLRIKEIVEHSGTGFAFPSQTLYVAQDTGLDESLTAKAETEVDNWRAHNALPFPRMTRERMDTLDGTLDYPPKGSSFWAQAKAKSEETEEPLSKTAETGTKSR
ncbi:mechanosensitive ion channel family protein [Roseibium sp. RKSG952]|uniref:mechanosensitive ion channel family protein n=1 Tax=Roseibium sp. RKSG952 TaxID=2529384 RepID=UPI0012BD0717|nr:mechanosensitive ion channel domain-containing protein [Roseibium sp. RKSG952]MTH96776.1 mechanosensitive ion channel [Roseibium sp. RKSG952]